MKEAGVESAEEQAQRRHDHRHFVGPGIAIRQSEGDPPDADAGCEDQNEWKDNAVSTGGSVHRERYRTSTFWPLPGCAVPGAASGSCCSHGAVDVNHSYGVLSRAARAAPR
jgi:hypothetical protein